MKNYKLLLVILLIAGISLGGCNLLGSPDPKVSLTFDGIQSASDLNNFIQGAYSHLQTTSGGHNVGQYLFTQEILTSDTKFVGSFPTYRAIYFRKMTPSNGNIANMWQGAYRNINDTNIILHALSKGIKGVGNKLAASAKGQALFIRSLQYFYLLKLFSLPASAGEKHMGVPLQLKPVTSQQDFTKPGRSSIKEVYTQIVNDLKTARGLLSTNPPYLASKGAATALLARIALVRGNYQAAKKWSGKVIQSKNYKLQPDVKTYFRNESSTESIFAIKMTAQDAPDPLNTSLDSEYNVVVRGGDIEIGPAFKNALTKELNTRQKSAIAAAGATAIDTRITELIVTANDKPVTGINEVMNKTVYSNKYEKSANVDDDVPVLRYSATILTHAEALARLYKGINNTTAISQKAIDQLNKIRERAFKVTGGPITLVDYIKSDFGSKQDLINAILNQRFIELAFEGHRKEDLQRTKRDVGTGARALPYNSPKLVFPIPVHQINANKNIQQNPGY